MREMVSPRPPSVLFQMLFGRYSRRNPFFAEGPRCFCPRWNQRAGTSYAKPHHTPSGVLGVATFLPPTTILRGLTHGKHPVVPFYHRKSPAILLLWHFSPGLTHENYAVGHYFHRKSPNNSELIDRAAPSSSGRLSLRD